MVVLCLLQTSGCGCNVIKHWLTVVILQVVNSTVGDIADDPTGVQSNSPIAAPPEVEVVDETKYDIVYLFVKLVILF